MFTDSRIDTTEKPINARYLKATKRVETEKNRLTRSLKPNNIEEMVTFCVLGTLVSVVDIHPLQLLRAELFFNIQVHLVLLVLI